MDKKSNGSKFNFQVFIKKLLVTEGLYLFSLVEIAPNIFIEYVQVIDALIIESRSTHLGADNLGWGGNILFYILEALAIDL